MAQWIGVRPRSLGAPADGEDRIERGRRSSPGWVGYPSPWAIGVAVMALLAFGVLVGSAVSPIQESGAIAPLVLAVAPRAETSAPSPAAAQTPTPPTAEAPEATPEATPSSSPAPKSSTAPKTKAKPTPKGTPKATEPGGSGTSTVPPVKHVFLIVLSDQGYNAAFGASSQGPYLAKTLTGEGELLEDFYGVSGGELANEIALVSGQGPTPQTAENCPAYASITPGTAGAAGQILGSGCVYPSSTPTLAEQLTAGGKTWKAYVEGIGGASPSQQASCPHPTLGSTDTDHTPTAEMPYVTWRDPFAYFESVTGRASCTSSIVGLGDLAPNLAKASQTPSLSYIIPDRCHDGSEEPCAPGKPAGLAATDEFLSTVIPQIESSPAYKAGGLIAITFDQAPQSGPAADSSGCCMTPAFPNIPPVAPSTTTSTETGTAGTTSTTGTTTTAPAATPTTPIGGGRVGLLLISKYVKPGSLNVIAEYNDFSLLGSLEELFGLTRLGYAGTKGLPVFNESVYNAHR